MLEAWPCPRRAFVHPAGKLLQEHRMGRIFRILVAVVIFAGAAGWYLTAPVTRPTADLEKLTGDAKHGEVIFWASGCASCHAAPGAKGADQLVLAGGQAFPSAFGTFYAPNISSDPTEGIGGWSIATFAHALQDGVTPEGEHEYPVMPYAAYAKMEPQDLVDLKAFVDQLPPSATPNKDHVVSFPFNIRRSLGGWKLLFGGAGYVLTGDLAPEVMRGRYIAEAMAHCGECHSPRNALGGVEKSAWLGGGLIDDGKAKVPNITPGKLTWSDNDIFTYLTTGATPDFDFAGGAMTHVVENMGHLPESDVRAVVAYLKAVPAVK
jgi:mono/diheme cytochrome c family protein